MKIQQIAIIIFAQWLTIVSVFLLYYNQLDIEIFFILGLFGFLLLVWIIEPNYVQPGYMRFIWYLIAIGFMIFSAIVIQKVLDILELEIVI